MENNKLGLGIIAFEGTELIAQCVMEIRDLVDYVVVGFQKKSYAGENCDPNDEYEVRKLKDEGIIDEILFIETNHQDFPRIQETEKRNKIIDDLKAHGCTHQLIIDSDEFYSHDSFAKAKKKIYDENIEISYCRYVNYFHDYTHYLVYPFKDGTYVPFIAKIDYKFSWQSTDFDKPSDPTRRYVRPKEIYIDKETKQPILKEVKKENGEVVKVPMIRYRVENYVFEWSELKMHHLSWLRNNIRKKMNAWSSKSYFKNYLEIIDKSAEKFENFEDSETPQETFLLFNTPGNKLEIARFNKQYIHPKEEYAYFKRVNHRPYIRNINFMTNMNNMTFEKMLKYLDDMNVTEQYKNHEGKWITRPKRTKDYIVFAKNANKKELTKFINSLQNESEIYYSKEKQILILGFDSVQKIRKYAQLSWSVMYDWLTAVEKTMQSYCAKNELKYENYMKEYK